MEILFVVLIGVVLVVRFAINQAKKDQAPTPRPRSARPARRGPVRPWEQTPPRPAHDAARASTADRPEPPAPETEPRPGSAPESPAPDPASSPAAEPALEPLESVDQSPEPEPEPEPEPKPDLEPEPKPDPDPGQPTPEVPTSTVYSASTPIYTPTSIYSGYTPTTLYESGSSVGGAQDPEEGADDSEDPAPQAGATRP